MDEKQYRKKEKRIVTQPERKKIHIFERNTYLCVNIFFIQKSLLMYLFLSNVHIN